MVSIGVRELRRTRLATCVWRRRANGVAVTERGTLGRYLVPVDESDSLLNRLAAVGEYEPPAGRILDLLPPPPVPEGKRPLSAVLQELRDEERW